MINLLNDLLKELSLALANVFEIFGFFNLLKFMESAKKLFSQKKQILFFQSVPYTNLVEGKTMFLFVEALPFFSINILLNKSDCGKTQGSKLTVASGKSAT